MNATSTVRTALITGSARGIGAVIARRLAQDGFSVAINYASSADDAETLAAELSRTGVKAIAVKGDVSKAADVRAMFDTIEQRLGKLDVLVNNAGIMKNAPVAEVTDELFDQVFAINARGTFNTLREAAKRLNDGGRIVNLSSTTLALKMPSYAVYNATKAAVEAFTHVLSKELGERRITVNAVAPGPVATDLFLHGKTDEQVQQSIEISPLKRLGEPEDIARVVAFLVGPDGAWVNGQVLRTNGGAA